MLTVELNEQIKQAYQNYQLDEQDEDFFFMANFDELKDGDFVFFPLNLRLGIYKVVKGNYLGTETNELVRCSCAVPLLRIPENQGVVLIRIPQDKVDWDFWDDNEELVSIDGTNGHSINWQNVHGFSNWYDCPNWTDKFPLDLLKHIDSQSLLDQPLTNV